MVSLAGEHSEHEEEKEETPHHSRQLDESAMITRLFGSFCGILRAMAHQSPVYAVIMAGGSGTRFWPASRSLRPKQLLPLAGTADSLLAATVSRLAPLVTPDRVFVVTGERIGAATKAALPAVEPAHILFEPAARNTAPCVAWAAAVIEKIDPNALVMVLPADHYITDEAAFRRILEKAVDAAAGGRLTTVGIVPTRPETGYGYIEVGGDLGDGVKEVARFVEKPNRERAEQFLAGKKHLWNAGMFFFRASHMMKLFDEHQPDIARGVREIASDPSKLNSVFPTLTSISVDNAIAEKAGGLAVVPGDFGWNDVGSWESAYELGAKDAAGNVVSEGSIAIDAKNNLIRSKKLVALVGVDDLVVVDTEDAVLVMPRSRSQDVRLVIEALKAAKRDSLL